MQPYVHAHIEIGSFYNKIVENTYLANHQCKNQINARLIHTFLFRLCKK